MQDLVFKSKIGYGILSFIVIVIGGSLLANLINGDWMVLTVLVPVIAFIAHLYLNTYYVINNDKNLIVKSGFYKITVPIDLIKKIEATKTLLSAPALSIDRLEVFYDRFDSVIISPLDKEAFIVALKKVNPAINSVI